MEAEIVIVGVGLVVAMALFDYAVAVVIGEPEPLLLAGLVGISVHAVVVMVCRTEVLKKDIAVY